MRKGGPERLLYLGGAPRVLLGFGIMLTVTIYTFPTSPLEKTPFKIITECMRGGSRVGGLATAAVPVRLGSRSRRGGGCGGWRGNGC